jgi:hypothetical protein
MLAEAEAERTLAHLALVEQAVAAVVLVLT